VSQPGEGRWTAIRPLADGGERRREVGWEEDDVNPIRVVPEVGVEPTWSYLQGVLSPANVLIVNN
jgi:hypothetical protein